MRPREFTTLALAGFFLLLAVIQFMLANPWTGLGLILNAAAFLHISGDLATHDHPPTPTEDPNP